MKKIISLILIIAGISLLSINIVKAVFISNAQVTKLGFKVADFVAPEIVELEKDLIMSLKSSPRISWSEVNDYNNTSDPVYYRLAIAGKEYKVNDNYFLLDKEIYPFGEYYFKVRACDQLNNCSDWSNEGLFSLIEPELVGDVNDISDYYQISDINSLNYWFDNYLQLEIDNNSANYLEFDYVTESVENLDGFDQTKLIVSANDEIIFIENQVLDSWEKVTLSLDTYVDNQLNLKFYSGNQGDSQYPSWVKIKNISFAKGIPGNSSDQNFQDNIKDLGIYY